MSTTEHAPYSIGDTCYVIASTTNLSQFEDTNEDWRLPYAEGLKIIEVRITDAQEYLIPHNSKIRMEYQVEHVSNARTVNPALSYYVRQSGSYKGGPNKDRVWYSHDLFPTIEKAKDALNQKLEKHLQETEKEFKEILAEIRALIK